MALNQAQSELFTLALDGKGKVPVNSAMALTSSKFRHLGELMAKSLVQGGPAPNFMATWVYDAVVTPASIHGIPVDVSLIRNQSHTSMITMVRENWSFIRIVFFLIFNKHLIILERDVCNGKYRLAKWGKVESTQTQQVSLAIHC